MKNSAIKHTPHTPSGKAFLGESGWILASKTYIHYVPWLLCPYEHLNTFLWPLEASRRPKSGLKMANFHGFEPRTPGRLFLGGSGWILASKAYIHYGPWLLCPDEPLKCLIMASGSLKKAQNRPQNGQFSWFWTPYTFLESFFGWIWVDPCQKMALNRPKFSSNQYLHILRCLLRILIKSGWQ